MTTTITTLAAVPFTAGFNCGVVSALRRSSSTTTTDGIRGRISTRTSAISSSSRDALAADLAEGAEQLFAKTPLIRSEPLSALVGKPVYLKLDALQASGSFKVSKSVRSDQIKSNQIEDMQLKTNIFFVIRV